jgi:hypothetical protein
MKILTITWANTALSDPEAGAAAGLEAEAAAWLEAGAAA